MILETYLIFSATGRQGSSVVDALLAKNANIVGTSRNPESLRKKRGMLYCFTIRVIDLHEMIATSVLKIVCSSRISTTQEVQSMLYKLI